MRTSKIQQLAILLVAISPFLAADSNCMARANEAASEKSTNHQVNALIKKGIGKAKENDFHQAISCFNEAIKLDPESYDGFVNRGWTFRQMGDFEKAIADYTSAINAHPTKPQVYLNRGWCHKRVGKADDALNDFNKAIELDPKYINAYRNRGSLKLKMGDYAGSIADFNQVMVLDPNAKTEVAKYLPKEMMNAPKKLDPQTTSKITTQIANAIQGSSIEISDTDLAKLNNRAARAIKTGEFASAITILEDITKKKPNYTFAKENLTTAYNNQGLKLAHTNPEQSAEQFRKALFYSSPQQGATRANLNVVLKSAGKDPQSDAVRVAIGDDLLAKGDYKGAFVEYMEALRLNKTPEVTEKISEVLVLIDAEKKKDQPVATASSSSSVAEPKSPELGVLDDKTGRITMDVVAGANGTVHSEAPEIVLNVENKTKWAESKTAKAASTASAKSTSSSSDETADDKSTASSKSGEVDVDAWGKLPGAEATPLSLIPAAKVKIGHDKDTYKLKWHNHVTRGDALYDQGNYMEAENEYKESLLAAKKLDDGGTEIIDSLERLSRIFLVQKRPVEALSLLEQAYNLRKDTQITPDPVGLERLGKKVLALRHMLYPHQKPEDEDEDEEDTRVAAKEAAEEKVETASAGTPDLDAPRKKKSPFAALKRKKTPLEADMEKFEEAGEGRSTRYSSRPTWDEFHK
ncbi:MAG: tetratricopeptide repeat protein [Candidatus Melainabacteria bacterium]|nr:tetratricopeptide repeat protein [Candidatus Melainabacteria bacterium]